MDKYWKELDLELALSVVLDYIGQHHEETPGYLDTLIFLEKVAEESGLNV